MEALSNITFLAILVGLVMLFIRKWRRIGIFTVIGGLAVMVSVVIPMEDRAAVEAGFEDAVDLRAAEEAGFTDPEEWAVERVRLQEEEEERERQEAAAERERERQEAAAERERERQEAAAERERKEAEAERKRQEAAAERERERQERIAQRQEKQEERRKGFHCLSAWDGSHSNFKRAVKEMMRNPSSFEHVETRITPVDEAGNHSVLMTYRAENGFGGVNIGQAMASVSQSDCSYTVVSVE